MKHFVCKKNSLQLIWKIPYEKCIHLLMLFLGEFQAVNQLCSHFEAYRDIPKITDLREKFKNIKQILKSHVFSDFSRCVVLEADLLSSNL